MPISLAAMRTGFGIDVHRFGGSPPLLLCGVVVSRDIGLEGTSDGDVAAHALCDALLGATALGDMGTHFEPSSGRFADADSMELLAKVALMVKDAGFVPTHVDVTVMAQQVRIAPHRQAMVDNVAASVGLDTSAVSVKATTTDGLGFVGRNEGIAAMAVASVTPR